MFEQRTHPIHVSLVTTLGSQYCNVVFVCHVFLQDPVAYQSAFFLSAILFPCLVACIDWCPLTLVLVVLFWRMLFWCVESVMVMMYYEITFIPVGITVQLLTCYQQSQSSYCALMYYKVDFYLQYYSLLIILTEIIVSYFNCGGVFVGSVLIICRLEPLLLHSI